MSTEHKKYRFTSGVGLHNASMLLALHEAGTEINDEALKTIAASLSKKFGKEIVQVSTEGGALGRVRRDLERLKGNRWVIPGTPSAVAAGVAGDNATGGKPSTEVRARRPSGGTKSGRGKGASGGNSAGASGAGAVSGEHGSVGGAGAGATGTPTG